MKCDYCGKSESTLTFKIIKGRYRDTIRCVDCEMQ